MSKKRSSGSDTNIKELLTGKVETIDDLINILTAIPRPPPSKRRRGASSTASHVETGPRRLIRPLLRLQNLVGMEGVKKTVLAQLLYFLQELHDGKLDMLHSVIQGPPGVGKTELANILADIYCSIGILKTSRVVVARRSDLIGKYLGHTADKTQGVIDDAYGGVLLIDEAYSLGYEGDRDSFSKECLDTLNQNLTENGNHFMCIIAGYEKALEECFFSANEGLSRRFNFRYTIKGYAPKELREIFMRVMIREQWLWESDEGPPQSFFDEHTPKFPFFGGDMESLFVHAKLAHAKHLFMNEDKSVAKKLSVKDLEEGLRTFTESRNKKEEMKSQAYINMYL